MKILATLDTADFRNCVNTGYRFDLYSDGHLSATYHSCWQRSLDGARYITAPGHVDVSTIDSANPDKDALAVLTAAVQHTHSFLDEKQWTQVRRGKVVR